METKFNFNSQICTTREQSERLIALGIKKETADMSWVLTDEDREGNEYSVEYISIGQGKYQLLHPDWYTPAWSLGRLIEMLPSPIPISEILPTFHHYAYLDLSKVSAHYYWEDYDGIERRLASFCGNGFFAAVVDATKWLIMEGYFNEEYLEE